MVITATELKNNLGKYISMADTEDIIITKNGNGVARLTNAKDSKLLALRSLRGVLKDKEMNLDNARKERLSKYYDEIID